ncbi:hypothetical protein DM01DRAFT_1223371 [Hesseltinella vesiculosa]|uniref:ACB domain-containing protein n=1 Tax=Hesseltinella vesiculosa TaxID=101127 RepID=A0A1X2GPH3_9FUNG|nr:hypothetical protein DM01DRAFT_1223371 [Hesseltinella vesiculosa]
MSIQQGPACLMLLVVPNGRDAWKAIEGLNALEAQHQYVEVLLKAAQEAFLVPTSKPQAQEILQTFAKLQPPFDDDTSTATDNDDIITTTTEDEGLLGQQEEEDDEEQAYLKDVQASSGRLTPVTRPLPTTIPTSMIPHGQYRPPRRPSSAMSNRSTNLKRLGSSPVPIPTSKPSTSVSPVALKSIHPAAPNRGSPSFLPASRGPRRTPSSPKRVHPDHFDHPNPWASSSQGTNSQPRSLSPSSTLSPLDQRLLLQQQQHFATSHTASSSPILGSTRLRTLQSPLQHPQPPALQPGSSNSSTITATATNLRSTSSAYLRQQSTPTPTSVQQQRQQEYAYASVVSLGPATKRALETLQAEIIALNERVDDIRQEILRRNPQHAIVSSSSAADGDDWDGWKWVIKAAIKHAAVNLLTVLLLYLLFKRGPLVSASQFSQMWHKLRNRLRVVTVVV